MEAFSLLKYWRGSGGGCSTVDGVCNGRTTTTAASTTTIVTTARHSSETDEDDNGPFFDLELTVDEEGEVKNEDGNDEGEVDEEDESDESDGENDERELKFTLSSGSSRDLTDPNASLSPSDDLFFKGRLVPIEPSSSLVLSGSEPNSKFHVSLLKSATKFRVLMLKLKKSKSNVALKTESNLSTSPTPKLPKKKRAENQPEKENQTKSKFFTVKFKVEEMPIVSLFTRDNSSKCANNKAQKQNSDESTLDEKRFSKDVMQRYFKKVKPLYIRTSKRYGDKLKFSGQLSLSGGSAKAGPLPTSKADQKSPPAKSTEVSEVPKTNNVRNAKQGNLPAGLRVVCKHLGKSKSASSAVAAAPPGQLSSKRRDDSLLQQQDGIQSAILHCKRSFNASRDSESSILSRSISYPLYEKSINNSSEEGKEKCN